MLNQWCRENVTFTLCLGCSETTKILSKNAPFNFLLRCVIIHISNVFKNRKLCLSFIYLSIWTQCCWLETMKSYGQTGILVPGILILGFTTLSIYLSIYLSIHLSIYISIYPYIYISQYLFSFLSLYLSKYESIFPSIYLLISNFLITFLEFRKVLCKI